MQPPPNPLRERGGTRGDEGVGEELVKGCALRNRANIYVTESCRRTKKVFWVSKEKKSDSERESARDSEWGKGVVEGERGGKRRRIMKTTMGERAPLKLVQFCSRRRATTRTTTMTVVAAQYRV